MQRRSSWTTFVFVIMALMLVTAIVFAVEVEGKRRVRKSKRSKQQQKKKKNQIKAVKGPDRADEKLIKKRIMDLADGNSNAYPRASENNHMHDDMVFYRIGGNMDRQVTFMDLAMLRAFRVTRVAYSEEDKYARSMITEWMQMLGLEVETDEEGVEGRRIEKEE